MKTNKKIGEMTYNEFIKEGIKFTVKTYAIIGVCYGIYYLIKNKPQVKPVSEDIDENITEEIEED